MTTWMDDAGPCLREEDVLAWIEGALDPETEARFRAHIETCDVCFETVGAAHLDSARTPPRLADRYAIHSELGRGGMGIVYRAHDAVLGREVAIKVLQRVDETANANEGLLNESRAMARLRHENVLTVYDVVEEDAAVYLVMELVEGVTLRRWVDSQRPSLGGLWQLAVGVGRGLHAAHEAGVVHGDLKPENVLVSPNGRPQLVDFGLARGVSRAGAPSYTRDGTPAYMAPEQHRGVAPTPRSDQFAFCVTFWELLGGQRPTPSARTNLASARRALPTAPPHVVAALVRGLSNDPAERHASVAALLDALRHQPDRVWTRATAGVLLGVVALTLLWLARPLERECTTLEPPSVDWALVERHFDARDGSRGRLLTSDVHVAQQNAFGALSSAHDNLCERERVRTHSASGTGAIRRCLTNLEAQHHATLELLQSGTLDVAGDFPRQIEAIAWCEHRHAVAHPSEPDTAELRDAGQLHTFAKMQVLAHVRDERATDLARSLLQTSDDPHVRARVLLAGAMAMTPADEALARRWYLRVEAMPEVLADPQLGLRAAVQAISTDITLGHRGAQSRLAEAVAAVESLEETSMTRIFKVRLEELGIVHALYEGRVEEVQNRTRRLRELAPTSARDTRFAFHTDVWLTAIDGDTKGSLEHQKKLAQWQETHGLTPSFRLIITLAEIARTARLLGDGPTLDDALDRAQQLVSTSQTPLAVRRTYDTERSIAAAECGVEHPSVERIWNEQNLDPEVVLGKAGIARFTGRESLLADDDALIAFVDSIPLGPSVEVATPVARVLRRAGQAERARSLLEERVHWYASRFPKPFTTAEAHLVLGWTLVELEDSTAATEHLGKALALHPNAWSRAWAQVGLATLQARASRRVDIEMLLASRDVLDTAPAGWTYEREQARKLVESITSDARPR